MSTWCMPPNTFQRTVLRTAAECWRWADYRRPGEEMVVRPRIARVSRVRACMCLALLLFIALLATEGRAQRPANVQQIGYLISGP